MNIIVQNSALLQRLTHYTGNAKKDKGMQVFGIILLYLSTLSFVSSNISLFIVSIVFFVLIHRVVKNAATSSLLCFVVSLAFVKGKSISILMIPEALVRMNITRDVLYYFPITLSDAFLGVAAWLYLRRILYTKKSISFSGLEVLLACLVLASALSAFATQHLNVTTLATIQIGKLLLIYHLWGNVKERNMSRLIIMAVSALVFFEGAWGFLQFINRGSLGRYIESSSLIYEYGKTAWENPDLLRISGTFVDPDIYGTFMYMHAVFFSSLLFLKRYSNSYEKWVYFLCALVSGTALFLSGNRIIYVLFVLYFVFIVTKTRAMKTIREHMQNKALVVVVLSFVLAVIPYVFVRMQNLPAVFSKYGSGTFRLQMLVYSGKLGLSNVFGVGIGTSPYHFATQFAGENLVFGPDYPHNIFSQMFAETGFIGFFVFVGFCYLSFRALFMRGLRVSHSHYLIAAFAYFCAAQFYPLYVPLTELVGYFFVYLGISQSERRTA